jgi:hypothetical protein
MSSYDSWRTRSDRDEDERFGRTPEPEPEEEEPEWEFYTGPFAQLGSAIATTAYFNETFAGSYWKFGVFPDPDTTTKWIIKRTWR